MKGFVICIQFLFALSKNDFNARPNLSETTSEDDLLQNIVNICSTDDKLRQNISENGVNYIASYCYVHLTNKVNVLFRSHAYQITI